MTVYVSDSAKVTNEIVLYRCEHFEKISIFPTVATITKWFNTHTERNISTRQMDRYIHQLVYGGLWKRWPRKKKMGSLGRLFTSAGTSITNKGLHALEWARHKAFEIMAAIRAKRPARKKRSPSTDVKGDRSGSTARIGTVIKGIMKLPVSS